MNSKKSVKNYYKDNPHMVSSPFGGVHDFDTNLLEEILSRLEINYKNIKILDVGCGRGLWENWAKKNGSEYFGTDLVQSENHSPNLILGDGESLPFHDNSFDLVTCIDSFEHFPEPVMGTEEFFRVLKPGGVAFISAPNYANIAGCVKFFAENFGSYKKNTWAPFGNWMAQENENFVTPGKLVHWFEKAGFTSGKWFGFGKEIDLGIFPWSAHPKCPEFLKFKLQKLSTDWGEKVVEILPSSSLHIFCRFDKLK